MSVNEVLMIAAVVLMSESFRGVMPFLASDFIRVLILGAFPVITLGLLRLLG